MTTPDSDRIHTHLQTVPYFAGLDAATLRALANLAILHEYSSGAIIFFEGEAGSGLYGIQSGWVKLVKLSVEGREQVLRYAGPSEVFGEIGLFLMRPNPATCVALEPCALWQLRRADVQTVLALHPGLALQVMANMADRIAYLAGLVADLSLHSVEVRLARLLLDEAPDGRLDRPPWLTQAELAARLGTVPDVLNRVLRILADDGLIRVDRRHIIILDRTALSGRALLEG